MNHNVTIVMKSEGIKSNQEIFNVKTASTETLIQPLKRRKNKNWNKVVKNRKIVRINKLCVGSKFLVSKSESNSYKLNINIEKDKKLNLYDQNLGDNKNKTKSTIFHYQNSFSLWELRVYVKPTNENHRSTNPIKLIKIIRLVKSMNISQYYAN